MTLSKRVAFPIIIIVAVVLSLGVLVNNNRKIDVSCIDPSTLPIYRLDGSPMYDPSNPKEAVGICDYVFVGKVVSNDGTQYRDKILVEDEKGKPIEVGTPYTDYTVVVTDNIKGNLQTDEPITIIKRGGIINTGKAVIVFENDFLPEEGNLYIFLGYAQEEGWILISGPNSNIALEIPDGQTAKSTSEYQTYEEAFLNEIIPAGLEAKRFKSIYED